MAEYRAPTKEMLFIMNELSGLQEVAKLPGFEDATLDVADAVVDAAARLANEIIAPTNQLGDAHGSRIEDGKVVVPAEFKAAYLQAVADGWPALAMDPEYGGQGMPYTIGIAMEEMWQSANLAWSLCGLLTTGAVHAIEVHANDELKSAYLPKMVSGEWTGTMNLTEPQAGSDLAAVRARAERDGDHYRISGQKIYITWGDHDMTDNVIHLVLARLPDAPEGVKGISLFLVPKFLLNADGTPGERNSLGPISVEHKLGITASPTCVMSYENAIGYAVGPEHNGLACMFTMMNRARISVGLEGLAIAERAYQQALSYARERVQGYLPGEAERVTIIHHPDVRRMLMTMKANIEAMRGVAYSTAAHMDRQDRAASDDERAYHAARVDLMTPIVKGWCTEIGQLMTSVGVQVHGGMGFIEETGAAQHYRDSRITTIYEGTTGIQANDLVGRKILRDGGRALTAIIAEMRATVAELQEAGGDFGTISAALEHGTQVLEQALGWLLENGRDDAAAPGSVGYSMLMLFGTVAGGWQLARAALAAGRMLTAGNKDTAFLEAKKVTAQFFAEQCMPQADAYLAALRSGSSATMGLAEKQF